MDSKAVLDLVDELEENLDDLEDNLSSVLTNSLTTTSRKLPLLDRAKLNVLLVYSIESLLFSYLKIHGAQVKEHPIFRELTRVKQYFEKIKAAESGPSTAQPTAKLNKDAAARVIKHGLAGNEKYDLERAEREAREKFLANRKLKTLEAKLKEQATQDADNHKATSMNDVLVEAAQLAATLQEESINETVDSDSGSDDDDDSSEEGEVTEQPVQTSESSSEFQQGKTQTTKLSNADRKAKRKRETAFQASLTGKAGKMERRYERKRTRKAKKAATKAEEAGLSLG